MKWIIYTRPDGRVFVLKPRANAIRWMTTGGRWNDERPGFVSEQIERLVARGHSPALAERYCKAMASGGLTEAEALALTRDRENEVRPGTAHELINPKDLPDRWFRNAWRRSHNGGPIGLDLEACRVQQWDRIRSAADEASKLLRPPAINLGALRDAILSADEPDDIRRIWIDG